MGTTGSFEDIGQNIADIAREAQANVEERVEDMSGREGNLTRRIERYTSALPSSTWLAFAAGALVGSLTLRLMGRDKTATFVGEWVPTFLLLGIYNKLVKLHGSDREM